MNNPPAFNGVGNGNVNVNASTESDEDFARRLQEQFDRESHQNSSPPSFPVSPFLTNPPPVAPPVSTPFSSEVLNPTAAAVPSHFSSHDLALVPTVSAGPIVTPASDGRYFVSPVPEDLSFTHQDLNGDASAALALQLYEDELHASRYQQQIHDEQLAAATQRQYYGGGTSAIGMVQRRRGTSLWCYLPTFIVLGAAAYFVYYSFTGRDPLNADSGLEGLQGIIKRWDGPDFLDGIILGKGNGPAVGEDIGWKPNGKHGVGLVLTVANACSSDWDEHFSEAVSEWDRLGERLEMYGNVDILELTKKEVGRDVECSQSPGLLKVCNGNYGDTGWKGINEVRIQGGYISSSVAKMNEFYLGDENGEGLGVGAFGTKNRLKDERRYTMCHELGHGLGLGHQDTDFLNADLNTCMDYTNRPWNNLVPNEGDFVKLGNLYGGDDFVTIVDLNSSSDGEETQTTASEAEITTGSSNSNNYGKRRLQNENTIRGIESIPKQKNIFSFRRIKADKVIRSITSEGEVFETWTYYTPAGHR